MDTDELLPWGLTWDELTRYAAKAARMHYSRLISYDDRYTAALDGITMTLAESVLPPSRRDLLVAATAAISQMVNEERCQHGLPAPAVNSKQRNGKRFDMYWRTGDRLECPFTDGIEERVAIYQVWDQLGGWDQNTLDAISEFGDDTAAARAMGLTRNAYASRLMKARRRARALWFDWESDPGHYSNGRRRDPGTSLELSIRRRVNVHRSIARRQRNSAA